MNWLYTEDGLAFFRTNDRKMTRRKSETYDKACPTCSAPPGFYCRRLNESKKPGHVVKNNISRLEPHPERRKA